MLTPILSARALAMPSSAIAAAAEQAPPKDKLPAATPGLSGRQSLAMLRILETINRQLLGSETLPKEALVRLMETLSRILKFPPLPQESIRDFGKRLASYLENLPPAARLVLERQLAQRSLAVPLRILTETLRNPTGTEATRLQTALQSGAVQLRPLPQEGAAQPRPAPLPAATAPSQPPQQPTSAAGTSVLAAMAAAEESGFLQAALKKTFGGEPAETIETSDEAAAAAENGTGDQPDATSSSTARPSTSGAAAANAASQRSGSDPLPELKAAVAFLAGDPEALTLVTAITAEGSQPAADEAKTMSQEAGDDAPALTSEHEAGSSIAGDKPQSTPAGRQQTAANGERLAALPEAGEQQPTPETPQDALQSAAEVQLPDIGEGAPRPRNNATAVATTPLPEKAIARADGPPSALLSNPAQDAPSATAAQSPPATGETMHAAPEAGHDPFRKTPAEPQRGFAHAGFAAPVSSDPLAQLIAYVVASETVTPEVLSLLGAALRDEDSPLLEAALKAASHETLAKEAANPRIDSAWDDIGETREAAISREKSAALAFLAATGDNATDLRNTALAMATVPREIIPFALMPYLPAQEMEASKTTDEAEHRNEDEDDDTSRDETGSDAQGERSRDEEQAQALATVQPDAQEALDDDASSPDAYELYRRMGGLG